MMLSGETVLITGVGPGLGAKLARRAAAEGARVALAARSTGVTSEVAKEIEEAGGEAVALPCDVRRPEQIEALITAAVDRFGPITGLVNSAYSHPGMVDLLDTTEKQLRRSMDIIVYGALEVTRQVVPHMREAGHGSIVNVSTMATRKVERGDGGYALAKAAMGTATMYLAAELGEHGIRVNQAMLGWLDGPSVGFYVSMAAERRGVGEQTIRDELAARNPLGRIPPDDACAGPILFLLSRYASEVTGATLDVNGGGYMP